MKPRFVLLAALAATSLFALATESVNKLPESWLLSGQAPKSYEIGLDAQETVSGKGSKFIRNIDGKDKVWGTLMQRISATRYLGQRIRFQAKIKTRDVNDKAGLWLRVDAPGKPGAAFYNSWDKPIVGTTDWQLRSIVLDVPGDASFVSFGVINAGRGQVWIDDLSLEVVSKNVPVDQMPQRAPLPDRPNL